MNRPLPPVRTVTRAVVASQILFTAGDALTSGGFLTYFASTYEPSAAMLAVLLTTPELGEAAAVCVRPVLLNLGGRKPIWIGFLVAARVCALGVPLVALAGEQPGEMDPLALLFVSVAGWAVCQGIAYIAYISWLTDLVPDVEWGRFFAKRRMALLAVRIVVPVAAAWARAEWLPSLSTQAERMGYVVLFLAGGAIVLSSIIPMLRIPGVPLRVPARPRPSMAVVGDAFRDRSFRLLLIHSWWLALAQGLTQSAFFIYQYDVLGISVATYYRMTGVMLLLQIGFTWWGGRLSDGIGDRRPLLGSVILVSGAMVFWLAADPASPRLLYGAYAMWGLFGIVNLCGQNLALRLAPRSDNATHLALFRQIGGMLAGLAGLLGGFWLDRLREAGFAVSVAVWNLGPFELVFLASFVGRLSAAAWLVPIRDPRPQRAGLTPPDGDASTR